MARRWQSWVAGSAMVGLLFLTYALLAAQDDLSRHFTQQAYACIFNGIFWLLTAVLAATAIAQEKEGDTWTVLLATPLGGHAVVWGKVAGLCRRAVWPLVLFAGHFTVFAAAGVIEPRGAVLSLWVILTFNSIWVATGIYLSLRLRKVTLAVIVNLLLAVTIYLAAFFVLLTIGELGYVEDLPDYVAWYLPYYYLSHGLVQTWPQWQNGMLRMPGAVRVGREEFTLIVIGVGFAHLLLSALILAATAAAFDGIVGRARQSGPSERPERAPRVAAA
jgi:ABC-type transport system involved in multi-copper enzyme maturation permease subunit